MARVVALTAPRTLAIEDHPDPPLAAHEVRLATLYSGISAGTELASYRGTNPYLHKRWDAAQRLFRDDGDPSLTYPVRSLGYEEVGRVVERGAAVAAPAVGDLVYGTWGHRTHHVADAAWAAGRLLPEGLDPRAGVFSHIGAVALNGVHDARIRIGDAVVVFGLGVPGQIVAQLATRSGARVIGVEPIAARRRLALELGAVEEALDPAAGGIAEAIRERTDGRGADVAIEVSGAAPALHEAIRTVAYAARVVAMGFVQGEARGLHLDEEFHHNRIELVSSQISGVAPEQSYRWDKPRLAATAIDLQARGVLDLLPLITHTFAFEAAAEAFALLDGRPGEALQVLLRTDAGAASAADAGAAS
ncbi:MAG: zinc-binding alcohol dehydrogenase, partial [Trueperaceae bacterium]|nr:zinc-binding alcohol dehydrogenase [Trueperaceae bacterium]